MHNSMTKKDKTDYVLFFAHYLDDYSNAVLSEKSLKNVSSNIIGEKCKGVGSSGGTIYLLNSLNNIPNL